MKMFTNQGEYRAMQAEMQTIKALKIHPNIVHFLEVGEVEVKIKNSMFHAPPLGGVRY